MAPRQAERNAESRTSLIEPYYSAYLMQLWLFCFVLLPCLPGREATGSQNLQQMRTLLGSRIGHLKFHKTYECVSAQISGIVSFIQA